MEKILSPYTKGNLSFKNHLVMAPMTRSRAIDNIPNELMAAYYGQRTGAGLIVTEGTSPTPEGLGYPRIPAIYSNEQIEGWKKTTEAVHKGNSKIFLQLMHTGRIGNNLNLPEGTKVVGASDIRAAGQIYTDIAFMQDHSVPLALTTEGVDDIIKGHVTAAENAVKAGFDGIELHGANGYLIEQFLNPHVNNRTDSYGGSVENRARLAIETVTAIANAIGKEKVGIRFSPFSTFNDLPEYDREDVHYTYAYLAQELNKIGIAYLHIAVAGAVPTKTFEAIRKFYHGTIILCNGLTPESAEAALNDGFADLVAFGRSFISNPDLDRRIATNAPLNDLDYSTAYTPGPKGYIDYPALI